VSLPLFSIKGKQALGQRSKGVGKPLGVSKILPHVIKHRTKESFINPLMAI
jgi:hypothetical protein